MPATRGDRSPTASTRFDAPAALADIARVLVRRSGSLVLLDDPGLERGDSARASGSLIEEMRPEHPYFDGPSWRDALAAAGAWSEPRELRVTVNRPADPEGIPDYLVSMSWVAALDEESRREMLTRAAELVSAGETPDELPVHFRIALARLEGSSR